MGFDLSWFDAPKITDDMAWWDYPCYWTVPDDTMAELRLAMDALDMIDMTKPTTVHPEPIEYGLLATPPWRDAKGEIAYPADSAEAAWLADYRASFERDSGGVIPLYKLYDMAGWFVTPAEITRSLEMYDRRSRSAYAMPPQGSAAVHSGTSALPLEDWEEWIEWLRDSAEHGGFWVW